MRSPGLLATVLATLAMCAAAFLCATIPLLANPGPESAQVAAVVGGVAFCLAQAVRGAGRRSDGFLNDVLQGALGASIGLTVFVAVSAVGSALHPSCTASRGYLPFVVLAVPVLALQLAVGTWLGRLVGGAGRAFVAALGVQVGLAVWLAVDWITEPSFRVLSHFYVVVVGDLWRGAQMPPAAIAFRGATACAALALVLAGTLRYPRTRRASLSSGTPNGPAFVAGIAILTLAFVMVSLRATHALAPGHDALLEDYSLVKQRGPLVVHADPLATAPREVDAILAEGTLWLERLKARLGVAPATDIHVFLHADRGAEKRYTGASHVDFTLPWRHEIHIAGSAVPHGSLGHELAHAVAAELSSTTLRVPSKLVFLHDAAITEGVAVALTPELAIDDGLTIKEQAAAMRRAGLAPQTAALFDGVHFFTEAPARAYIAAGAVIESLVAHAPGSPTEALARLYDTGDLAAALGSKEAVASLFVAHDAALDALTLPADATAAAMARFQKPSILDETCDPGAVEVARSIRATARRGDIADALARARANGPLTLATVDDLYDAALTVEDDAHALELARIGAEGALGEEPRMLEATEAARSAVLGDALWRSGKRRDAVAAWMRAPLERGRFDFQRTLRAKRILGETVQALAEKAPVGSSALALLLAADAGARDGAYLELANALARNDAAPAETREPALSTAVARYMLGRRLVGLGNARAGAAQLRAALETNLLDAAFAEQAALLLGRALTRTDEVGLAHDLLVAAADSSTRPALRLVLRDRAERAARAAAAPEQPAAITATSDPAWADRLLLGSAAGND